MELTLTANFTIIITTHYIEEARQAHMVIVVCDLNCSTNVILLQVGLMRSGRLLAQAKPDDLITRYNVTVSYL